MYPYLNDLRYRFKNPAQPCTEKKRIVAYFPNFRPVINQIDVTKVTHLILDRFYKMKENGQVTTQEPEPENIGLLNGLRKKNPAVKILVTIGDYSDAKLLSDIAGKEEKRIRFAESLLQMVQRYGFDGIDIDWEYPVSRTGCAADKQNFTLMMKQIRDTLDEAATKEKKKYYLTTATAANIEFLQNTEMDKVQEYTDWINLMTYDFHGEGEPVSGHHSPLYEDPNDPSPRRIGANTAAAVQLYLEKRVRPENIVLGMPFNGYWWSKCCPSMNGEYQYCAENPEPVSLYYETLVTKYINTNGYVRYWNDASKVPFLFNPQSNTFITYTDPEAIRHKASFIINKCLGGAMIWELRYDYNNILLNEVYNSLNRC